jgi:pimeloyl-ACP methyl ester carboxylesterase
MNREVSNKRKIRQRRRKPPLAVRLTRLAFANLGSLLPSLFGAWAYRLWFSTRRFRAPRREIPWIENAHNEKLPLAGIEVMTYQWGEPGAPLVVLLHGWNGRGSQMAAFAEPLVQAGFRVLAYDGPGHGHTPGNSTNIFILRDVLQALQQRLGPIHGIVAHSFGGMVTTLALSEGLEARRVVLLSTPARIDYLIELFSKGLSIPAPVTKNLVKRIGRQFGEGVFEQLSTVNMASQLGTIPALIIHDANDHDVPLNQGEQLHAAWPNSEMVTTKGLGHKRLLYNGKVLAKVADFVK